ncbi:VWA domain-containing protein [Amycolatopsis pigmentata]|uniref:VWA domain-containing protein n=1 Tax=Amycolatopsis pigmentata TaxID=450801 RepID=A0ABW5FZM3_9PSEU
MEFDLQVHQNKFLSEGDTTMTAVVTLAAKTGQAPEAEVEAAEVLLVDCSTSMRWPVAKIVAARQAAAAAIDVLRDGVFFAVVAGTTRARQVYPERGMARADRWSRTEAKTQVWTLAADGGTAIGTWLTMAGNLLAEHPGAVRHAILLTDGQNQAESSEQLGRVLDACEGRFTCDARGIGEDWDPAELTRIVTVLRGTADSVVDEKDLAEDFRRLTEHAMLKTVPDVRLRLAAMPFSRLDFVKQVHPMEYDLTGRLQRTEANLMELSTGAWSEGEEREYLVGFEFSPGEVTYGQDTQLGWLQVASGPGDPVPVIGNRTRDPVEATRIDPKVQKYTVQGELAQAMDEGFAAYQAKDLEKAQRAWGRAVRLTVESPNDEMRKRLAQLVDVIDAAKGDVRLKENLTRSQIMHAVLGSRISTYEAAVAGGGPREPREIPCPHCGSRHPAEERLCPKTFRKIR